MPEDRGNGAPSLEPPRLWRKKPGAEQHRAVPAVPAPTAPVEATSAPARVDTPWVPVGHAAKPAKAARRSSAPKLPTPSVPRASRAPRQRIELPPLNPHLAASVTGLIVGAWLVLSTFTTLRMCESVRGASACGGPGLLLLVVIVTGGIALGAMLLRYFKVRSAGAMSFLAVALVAALVMLFFAGSLDQWWAIPVVAVLTVGAYALSHWMTTTYIDPDA